MFDLYMLPIGLLFPSLFKTHTPLSDCMNLLVFSNENVVVVVVVVIVAVVVEGFYSCNELSPFKLV
jgi:hypothetical protein